MIGRGAGVSLDSLTHALIVIQVIEGSSQINMLRKVIGNIAQVIGRQELINTVISILSQEASVPIIALNVDLTLTILLIDAIRSRQSSGSTT